MLRRRRRNRRRLTDAARRQEHWVEMAITAFNLIRIDNLIAETA
jgi:hypothetical protein